jgi:hypothetical protein
LLNHLHSATDTEHGQTALLRQLEECALDGIPLRGITSQGRKIVPSSQHKSGDAGFIAQGERDFDYVWNREGYQAAGRKKLRPGLIERVAALGTFRENRHPLRDSDSLHEMSRTF